MGGVNTSPDATQTAHDSMTSDKKFVEEAAHGSMMEVELGKLAQQNGSSEKVKEFGKKMVDDHTKASEDLKAAASKANIPLPDDEHAKKHKKMIDKLSKLQGAQFDKAYAKAMVKDHEQDVAAFQKQAENGQSPEIKAFAAKTLPVLQSHQQLAKDMQDSTKGMGSGNTGGNSGGR